MASKLKWRKHKDGSETAGPFRITGEGYGDFQVLLAGDFLLRRPHDRVVLRQFALRIARACAAALKEKP